MNVWDVFHCTPDMHVLPSTWDFRCKCYPDGLIKKLMVRFCVRSDRQIEGVGYFETFATVVQYVIVRLLLISSIHLNLATTQVDNTSAYLYTEIIDTVFVEMPPAYKEPGKVLKLNKSLYSLKQSSRNLFFHLKF